MGCKSVGAVGNLLLNKISQSLVPNFILLFWESDTVDHARSHLLQYTVNIFG